MIEEGQIYNHKKLGCKVRVKRYKEGSKIATFYYLNNDLTIQLYEFYWKESERLGIGSIKNLLPYENNNQLNLFKH
jgi:hypothetical protein